MKDIFRESILLILYWLWFQSIDCLFAITHSLTCVQDSSNHQSTNINANAITRFQYQARFLLTWFQHPNFHHLRKAVALPIKFYHSAFDVHQIQTRVFIYLKWFHLWNTNDKTFTCLFHNLSRYSCDFTKTMYLLGSLLRCGFIDLHVTNKDACSLRVWYRDICIRTSVGKSSRYKLESILHVRHIEEFNEASLSIIRSIPQLLELDGDVKKFYFWLLQRFHLGVPFVRCIKEVLMFRSVSNILSSAWI